MAVDVYCDEAGRGGGNLFDDQPWFVLAAHDYSDEEAAGILPPIGRAPEWKWATLQRRPRNMDLITETLSDPALSRSRISVFVAEKPYVAWLKLYEDLFGDPLNTPPGTRRDHAHDLWSVLGDHTSMPDVLNAYAGAVRTEEPGAALALDAALARLSTAALDAPADATGELAAVLSVMRVNVGELLHAYQSSNAERGANLDPHIAGLGVLFDKWAPWGTPLWFYQQSGPPWVRVHHHRIDALPAVYVDFISRLPGIESIDFLESAPSPAIQLADILAGAVAMAANSQPPRLTALPLWQWLREEAIDARYIWDLIAHPRHRDRYPLVRSR